MHCGGARGAAIHEFHKIRLHPTRAISHATRKGDAHHPGIVLKASLAAASLDLSMWCSLASKEDDTALTHEPTPASSMQLAGSPVATRDD